MIIEESQVTVKEISKSQNIRLVDVFIIAPILIYAGTIKTLPVWLKLALIVIGIATAFYNGKNYLKNI